MNQVDFYKLPRALQDALLEAFAGQSTPAPILVQPGTRPTALIWLAISAAAALLLMGLCAAGFGDLGSALSLHPTAAGVVYVALAALSVLGVVRVLALRAAVRALPFAPGVYLFPANIIEARDHHLRILPLGSVTSVTASPGKVEVAVGPKHRFGFAFADAARTEEVVDRIQAAREHIKGELDGTARRKLDPLEPPAIDSPFAPTVPLTRTAPSWERYSWLIAAGAGFVVGVGLFELRNRASDERMFDTARARDDVATYERYLARGRREREAVSQTHLPRAALRLAIAEGTVEAVDTFAQAHPKTAIQAEVDAARRAALVAELERARRAGTLAAVLGFAERYPGHGLDPALTQARSAVYARALARHAKQAPKGGEQTTQFVQRLLAHAERVGAIRTADGYRGSSVVVRVRRQPSEDMERADILVRKSPEYSGVPSLPSRYVEPARLAPHEQATASALASALSGGFDPEILTFEAGPPLEGSDADVLALRVPTLVVSYRIEPSGAAYASRRPRGIFMGLLFYFRTELVLPGEPEPLRMKHTASRRIPLDLLRSTGPAPRPGTLEAAVYDAMFREAFAELNKKFLARWFSAPVEPAP